jgi:hypothetical protein
VTYLTQKSSVCLLLSVIAGIFPGFHGDFGTRPSTPEAFRVDAPGVREKFPGVACAMFVIRSVYYPAAA